MNLSLLLNLADTWEREAKALRARGLEREASMEESFAEELRARLEEWKTEPLTILEAAEESAYSERHLRELISDGPVPNAGKPGAPRIRRCDLPAKPGSGGPALDVSDGSESLADKALTRRRP